MKTVPVLIAVALYFGLSFAVYTDDITEASPMGGYQGMPRYTGGAGGRPSSYDSPTQTGGGY